MRSDKEKYYLTTLSVAKFIQRKWRVNEYGALVEWYRQENTEVLGEKPVPSFFYGPTALVIPDLPSLSFRDHTQTHQTRYNCSGRVIGSMKRLTYTWQHTTLPWGRHPYPAGFEHAISAGERAQDHALDRATNEIGTHRYFVSHKSHKNSPGIKQRFRLM
jgi:hypothetical protein